MSQIFVSGTLHIRVHGPFPSPEVSFQGATQECRQSGQRSFLEQKQGASGDRDRGGSAGSSSSRDGNRRATPFGSRDSSKGSSYRHSHHHMVHFNGESSEDKEEDQGEMFEERVSFQDMLKQARAQSDIYSAEEDSEDEDFEPYTFQYKDKYETISPTSVATAATKAIPDAEVCAFATDD